MDEIKLSQYRSEVIEKFMMIEWNVNLILSQYFFKTQNTRFLFEFLYDPMCTFGLKRSVLEKIIPNIDSKQLNNLGRLNTIRNYFAHCSFGFLDKILDPRNLDVTIDFEKLHKQFFNIFIPVASYLVHIYQSLGGELKINASQ